MRECRSCSHATHIWEIGFPAKTLGGEKADLFHCEYLSDPGETEWVRGDYCCDAFSPNSLTDIGEA